MDSFLALFLFLALFTMVAVRLFFHNSSAILRMLDEPVWVLAFWLYTGVCFGLIYITLDYITPANILKNTAIDLTSIDSAVQSSLDFFYFSFIALATVGFGDISPISTTAKIATVLQSTLGLCVVISFALSATNFANKKLGLLEIASIEMTPQNSARSINMAIYLETDSVLIETASIDFIHKHEVVAGKDEGQTYFEFSDKIYHGPSMNGHLVFTIYPFDLIDLTNTNTISLGCQLNYSVRSHSHLKRFILSDEQVRFFRRETFEKVYTGGPSGKESDIFLD